MRMSYEDSDIVRWGMNILQGEPYSTPDYFGTTAQDNAHYYNRGDAREGNFGTDYFSVENDEIIARTLQEGFSQLSVAEASSPSDEGEEYSREAVHTQNWYYPSTNCYSGNDGDGNGDSEVSDDAKSSSSSTTPQEISNVWEDYDERLNQMVAIPHVPKINGEIPSGDEATSDHQRLVDRLQLYDLVEHEVLGDGNCQFRALSDQFYGTPEHHEFVRQQIVDQLKSHPANYEGYVPMDYVDYLEKVSMDGVWGDHVTLQAAADVYGVKIFVLTSYKDTCYIEILPRKERSNRVIFLSFWAEVHYNSIYPEEG